MDQTLTDLLASPYIRYRGRIAYDTVREVASRLELFKGATPGLAASVLMNTARSCAKVAETAEEEKRNELIDNAVVEAAADLSGSLLMSTRGLRASGGLAPRPCAPQMLLRSNSQPNKRRSRRSKMP